MKDEGGERKKSEEGRISADEMAEKWETGNF